jgi:hypothetical protein
MTRRSASLEEAYMSLTADSVDHRAHGGVGQVDGQIDGHGEGCVAR